MKNRDSGPQWDPSETLQKPENQDSGAYEVPVNRDSGPLVGPYQNQKTRTQDPSGTLVGPNKNQKTGTRDPNGTLVGPYKKPENRDTSGTLARSHKNGKLECGVNVGCMCTASAWNSYS